MMIKNENISQGIFPRGQRLKKEKDFLDGFDAYVRGLSLSGPMEPIGSIGGPDLVKIHMMVRKGSTTTLQKAILRTWWILTQSKSKKEEAADENKKEGGMNKKAHHNNIIIIINNINKIIIIRVIIIMKWTYFLKKKKKIIMMKYFILHPFMSVWTRRYAAAARICYLSHAAVLVVHLAGEDHPNLGLK